MENRSYAFFLTDQNTEKRKNIQILLFLPGINTPSLQGESIFRQSRQTLSTPTERGFQRLNKLHQPLPRSLSEYVNESETHVPRN